MRRLLSGLLAAAFLVSPAAAQAHYPDADYSAMRVKEWQRTKHISCDWFRQIGGGCRNQQVVYNQRTGDHSRLIGVYIEFNNAYVFDPSRWQAHYDCVRRDHDGDLSFWGHNACWGL